MTSAMLIRSVGGRSFVVRRQLLSPYEVSADLWCQALKKKEAYNGETTTAAGAAAVRHADGPKK